MMLRRKFIITAGGVLGSTITQTQSGWIKNFFIDTKRPVPGIPQQWVDLKGDVVNEYGNYILSHNFKNITPHMVLSSHFKTRRRVANDIPPRKMWKKIIPTLKVVDRIASETGLRIDTILSAYRSPQYNRAVRGKSKSFHTTNQAIDIEFANASSWKAAKVVRSYRDQQKAFKGGVGLYRGFIHVDTRGQKADW